MIGKLIMENGKPINIDNPIDLNNIKTYGVYMTEETSKKLHNKRIKNLKKE